MCAYEPVVCVFTHPSVFPPVLVSVSSEEYTASTAAGLGVLTAYKQVFKWESSSTLK